MPKKLLSFVLPLALLSFLSWLLYKNWISLGDDSIKISFFPLSVSIFIYLLAALLGAFFWSLILSEVAGKKLLKSNFTHLKAIKVSLYSFLTRYIPGKVVTVASKVFYGTRVLKVSKRDLSVSVFWEYFFLLTGSFSFAFLLLDLDVVFFSILPVVVLISLRFKKAVFFVLYILGRFVLGVSFFILVLSIYRVPLHNFAYIISSFIVASALGFFAFFVPSGLGVRETFLTLFLTKIFPLEISIVISLYARIWAVAGDILLLFAINTPNVYKLFLSKIAASRE